MLVNRNLETSMSLVFLVGNSTFSSNNNNNNNASISIAQNKVSSTKKDDCMKGREG